MTANVETVLHRAKTTGGFCAAEFRYRRHREPYDLSTGLTCNLAPGHDGPHAEWMEDGNCNTSYGSVWPGGVDTTEWTDTGDNVPSPWTAEEIKAWTAVGP